MKDLVHRIAIVFTVSALMPLTLVIAKNSSGPIVKQAVPGTYSVIGEQINFNDNSLDSLRFIIEAKRKDNEDVIYKISESTEVKILSRNEIQSFRFTPVAEFVFVDRKVKKSNPK